MLRTREGFALGALVALLSVVAPQPAFAGDGTKPIQCDIQRPQPGCDLDVSSGDTSGDSSDGNGGDSGGDGGTDDGAHCTYDPAYPSAETIAALGGQPAGEGGWYFVSCYEDGGPGVSYGPVWIAGAAPVVSPEDLAWRARSRLQLPAVVVRLNPAGDQLVNLPTWLSLAASSWQAQSATASVPGVSVTATARPVRAVWSLGDGARVRCTGPGAVWRPGTDPMRSSPDCGYTYRRSSANASGAAYPVRVTVTWSVSWVGAGQSGTIAGLTTTGAVAVRVQESQAVIAR